MSHERRTFFVEPPCALSLECEEIPKLGCQGPAQFFFPHAETNQILLRQVHAAHLGVARNISNDIRQLERQS